MTELNGCNTNDEVGRVNALDRYEILDTDPEEAFDRITRLVKSILDVPMVTISLLDRNRQWLKSRQGIAIQETPRDISFCTHTIRGERPLIVPDALADARFARSPLVTGEPYIRSYAGVPLRTRDGFNIGALCTMDTKPRALDAAQISMLEDFARLVVDEFELRLLATEDSLTGAMSRRAFRAAAMAEIARSEADMGCAVIDLDRFKAINDQFGHGAGDLILQRAVSACKTTLRPGDYIGRIGGDEFAIMMPDVTLQHAVEAADQCRATIENVAVDVGGRKVGITASAGVTMRSRGETLDQILNRADLALYSAKLDGRNQTCALSETAARSAKKSMIGLCA
jgi:diguanylate cyclase (GGDEF)-like protein